MEVKMKDLNAIYRRISIRAIIFIALLLLILPVKGLSQQPPEVNWLEGPCIADLGDNIAQVELSEKYLFANGEDTRKIMEFSGNPPSNHEVGSIFPKDQTTGYAIYFDYFPSGYIRDDEKDSIDSDAILESIKKGTEEANKIRREKGFPPLNVIGWYEKPHYDVQSHNLVWTLLAESEGCQIVNYNVRLLGRDGYMSAILVTESSALDSDRQEIENIIANFSYKKGKRYAEFVQGDKVAKYGLTALIAGGAGAAAVKFGLFKFLAKGWKIVAIAAIAFLAFIRKIVKGILGKRKSATVS